ncbi:hypothetical protein S40288_11531 [Stachybotrys chartarum IBT 40288]|nr:hypothetical protein S40288_11531 [Stachybotrys chartarum IBT 40288]
MAMNRQDYAQDTNHKDHDDPLVQSATFIPSQFLDHVAHDVAGHDPFYALDGIFRFFAASEHQFINLMAELVERLRKESQDDNVMMELQGIYRRLQTHQERLGDALEAIKYRGGRGWPLASIDTHKKKAAEALQDLIQLFEWLIRRAATVSATCKGEMEVNLTSRGDLVRLREGASRGLPTPRLTTAPQASSLSPVSRSNLYTSTGPSSITTANSEDLAPRAANYKPRDFDHPDKGCASVSTARSRDSLHAAFGLHHNKFHFHSPADIHVDSMK